MDWVTGLSAEALMHPYEATDHSYLQRCRLVGESTLVDMYAVGS